MIRFKPLGETRVDDVVATLEDLYAETDKPVSAWQTIRVAPRAGVLGSVYVPALLLEHGAKLVAATVGDLYDDKPISGAAIARALDRDVRTVRRWLDQAKSMRLIKQPKSKRGWIPA